MMVFIPAFRILRSAHYVSPSSWFFLWLKGCAEEVAFINKAAFAHISSKVSIYRFYCCVWTIKRWSIYTSKNHSDVPTLATNKGKK